MRSERTFGMSVFVISGAWGNFLTYAFIGLVLFVLVSDGPDSTRVMTGFALLFVYMVAPLELLLLNLPRANLARASAARIDEIATELRQVELPPAEPTPSAFDSLVFEGVSHRYYHEAAGELFTLGPIDVTFTPGEITYLVGGNGSGKTTLAKLIVGLYRPEEGAIRLDDEPVGDSNRDRHRQLFSAIFSDSTCSRACSPAKAQSTMRAAMR